MLRIAIPTNRPRAVVNYMDALARSGAQGKAGRAFDPDKFDGLLLPGGCDINPARYGKARTAEGTADDDLDALQFDALAGFLDAGKPVLGICRGHELLNIAFGGTLIQHLPGAETHQSLPAGEDNVHAVYAVENTFLHRIYGPVFSVASSHHQAIDLPGKGMITAACSADGVIEAMEHASLPVWSVQFHPERMCFRYRRADAADGSGIFRFFAEQCRKSRARGGDGNGQQ